MLPNGEPIKVNASRVRLALLSEPDVRFGPIRLFGWCFVRYGVDVIDDVTISTVPVVIGTERRLFGGRPQTKTWTLASARSFPSGLVQAHYDRKR